jgi:hypothetical protein
MQKNTTSPIKYQTTVRRKIDFARGLCYDVGKESKGAVPLMTGGTALFL